MGKDTENMVLIFAGGVGQRMKSGTKPKQFLELYGKPIIIYTLEVFEKHPEIDGIVVVCVEGWQTYLEELIEKYGIRKVRAIVLGGKTGQESIRHGVYKIHELCSEDSFVLVHDGVRPLIEAEDITRNIQCAREHGNAVTVAPVVETVGTKGERENETSQIFDRSRCLLLRAPQTFRLRDLYDAHKKAEQAALRSIAGQEAPSRFCTTHAIEGVAKSELMVAQRIMSSSSGLVPLCSSAFFAA